MIAPFRQMMGAVKAKPMPAIIVPTDGKANPPGLDEAGSTMKFCRAKDMPAVSRSRLSANEMGPVAPWRVVLRKLAFTWANKYGGERGHGPMLAGAVRGAMPSLLTMEQGVRGAISLLAGVGDVGGAPVHQLSGPR